MRRNQEIEEVKKKTSKLVWLYIIPYQILLFFITREVFDTNKILPLLLTLVLGGFFVVAFHRLIVNQLFKQYGYGKINKKKLIAKNKLSFPSFKLFFILTGLTFFITGGLSLNSITKHFNTNKKSICCAQVTNISRSVKRQNYYVKYRFIYNKETINGVFTDDLKEYNGSWHTPIGIPIQKDDEYYVLIDSLKLQHNELEYWKLASNQVQIFKQQIIKSSTYDVSILLNKIEEKYGLKGLIAYYHKSRIHLDKIDKKYRSDIEGVLRDQKFISMVNESKTNFIETSKY